VTEAITGLDLVEWQLRVASGEPLPLQQDQLRIHGHAIEARICAENPDNNFLPATGLLKVYRKPNCTSFEVATHDNKSGAVRIDDGVREGDSISPYYDSMIAKLIVHADTREQALTRLDVALAQLHIVGVQNNVAFVRRVIRTDSFAKAHLDTALIEREKAALFHQQTLSAPQSIAAVVAALLRTETTEHTGWTDPWSVRQSWLMQGRSVRSFHFEMHGEKHTAALTSLVRGGMRLHIDGKEAAFSWRDVAGQLQ
jgi:3-methylcrotonyl-CoA carboxylase alpha subunit